jgi:cytochrome P450
MAGAVSLDRSLRDRPKAPAAVGPRYRTPLAFLAALRRDPLAFVLRHWREHGDAVEIRFGFPSHWKSFMFFHPDDVRHVLQEQHRHFSKGIIFQKLKRIAGEGLVFSDGALWRRQRQLIQPAFHRERIAAMADMMADSTAALLDRWAFQARSRTPIDAAAEMSKLTLEIVSKALFGTDLGDQTDEFADAVTAAMTYANHIMNHFVTPPLFVPTAANRHGARAIARIDRVVSRIIEQRRREATPRHDLLGMLISARDAETNQAMDDKQLRDEIVTFLVAGHETTALALSWAWHLLAQNPAAEQRLHAQVDEALTDGRPAAGDLAAVPYARMVIEESLRLYPPAWATSRETLTADVIGGLPVPARATITLSPYATHRHPAFWDDPERFDPERFTPERSAQRPEFAYFPFGGGPRGCVGKQFAMMEGQIVLAMVARRFRLQSVPGHPVEPNPILTLRPRDGLMMTLEPRGH